MIFKYLLLFFVKVKRLNIVFIIILSVIFSSLFSVITISIVFAHGGNSNLIHGCVGGSVLNGGRLRIISSDQTCNSNETPLDWGKFGYITCDWCDIDELKARFNITTTVNQQFDRSQLLRLNAQNANFSGSSFKYAQLRGAYLVESNLSNSDFSYASISQLSFSSSQIDADLTSANLTNSNFTSTNFFDAELQSANLTNANFTNSNLSYANLSGAITSGTVFTGVRWDNTTCPDGSSSNSHGNTCIGHL